MTSDAIYRYLVPFFREVTVTSSDDGAPCK